MEYHLGQLTAFPVALGLIASFTAYKSEARDNEYAYEM